MPDGEQSVGSSDGDASTDRHRDQYADQHGDGDVHEHGDSHTDQDGDRHGDKYGNSDEDVDSRSGDQYVDCREHGNQHWRGRRSDIHTDGHRYRGSCSGGRRGGRTPWRRSGRRPRGWRERRIGQGARYRS